MISLLLRSQSDFSFSSNTHRNTERVITQPATSPLPVNVNRAACTDGWRPETGRDPWRLHEATL